MKTLIVYYSLEGFTRKWAEKIAEQAGCDLLELRTVKDYPTTGAKKFIWGGKSAVMGEKPKLQPYAFDPEEYERIILAYPVWASRFAPPVRSFIEENAEALRTKKIGAIATFKGSGAEKSIKQLSKLLGTEPDPQLILTDLEEKAEENEKSARAFAELLS